MVDKRKKPITIMYANVFIKKAVFVQNGKKDIMFMMFMYYLYQ